MSTFDNEYNLYNLYKCVNISLFSCENYLNFKKYLLLDRLSISVRIVGSGLGQNRSGFSMSSACFPSVFLNLFSIFRVLNISYPGPVKITAHFKMTIRGPTAIVNTTKQLKRILVYCITGFYQLMFSAGHIRNLGNSRPNDWNVCFGTRRNGFDPRIASEICARRQVFSASRPLIIKLPNKFDVTTH